MHTSVNNNNSLTLQKASRPVSYDEFAKALKKHPEGLPESSGDDDSAEAFIRLALSGTDTDVYPYPTVESVDKAYREQKSKMRRQSRSLNREEGVRVRSRSAEPTAKEQKKVERRRSGGRWDIEDQRCATAAANDFSLASAHVIRSAQYLNLIAKDLGDDSPHVENFLMANAHVSQASDYMDMGTARITNAFQEPTESTSPTDTSFLERTFDNMSVEEDKDNNPPPPPPPAGGVITIE